MEFYRGGKVISARSGMNIVMGMHELAMRNTRRYGGYVIHFGMVLIFVGLAGAAFNKDVLKSMNMGDSMQIGPYTLILQSADATAEKNYTAQRMIIEVLKNNKQMMLLYPEKRRFQGDNQESGTMVSIYSSLKEDLYVVYSGQDPDTNMPGRSRVSESAREMDLAGRLHRGLWHLISARAESSCRDCARRRACRPSPLSGCSGFESIGNPARGP